MNFKEWFLKQEDKWGEDYIYDENKRLVPDGTYHITNLKGKEVVYPKDRDMYDIAFERFSFLQQ